MWSTYYTEGRSIVRNAQVFTAFLLAVLLSGPILAQDDKPAAGVVAPGKEDIDGKIGSITTHVVMTPVTVTDHGGNIINGLTPADFRLTDNGKAQKITEDMTTHPISMVIAVQANSEVEKMLPAIQKLGSAIQAQILGDDGEAAVIEFDHRIQTLGDFSSDPDKLAMALKKLKPGSLTSRLNDATIEGINMLKKRPDTRRRVLLLIAESLDKGSELRPREVLSAAEFADVVIYSIDISKFMSQITAAPPAGRSVLDNRPPGAVHMADGSVETSTTQSQNAMGNWVPLIKDIYDLTKGVFVPNPLHVYTTYTGGRQYTFKTQREIERAVSELGEELHSQYLLTYSPTPATLEEAGYHDIRVQVLKPDMKIRARDGYYWAGIKTQ
jgi:VWFA-related protein